MTESGKIHVSFVTSKSRLAPLNKVVTIPRLELLGNLLLSGLMTSVLNALETELEITDVVCFTDSQVSLAWIRNVGKEMKQFVQNRVNEIRKKVSPNKWHYCKTSDNPADLITRVNYNSIANELWWHGPEFIRSNYDFLITSEDYNRDNLQQSFENSSDFKNELKSSNSCVTLAVEIEKINTVD